MRYKRVLLVFPAFKSDAGSARPSPSIGYLSQALEDHNVFYDVFDMKLGYSFQDLVDRVDRFRPDLIGFTIFTLKHKAVYELIERLKGLRPDISMHLALNPGTRLCRSYQITLQNLKIYDSSDI